MNPLWNSTKLCSLTHLHVHKVAHAGLLQRQPIQLATVRSGSILASIKKKFARDVPPPSPRQDSVSTIHHGYKRIDEYKWIEDINNGAVWELIQKENE
ncbi:hypothetical protein BC943DRAFT_149731 [Umbelopsis sp. AD052]|nr:hypothetical protein BC943DRAFT_149731 [Umbelopsis sp. AD052]